MVFGRAQAGASRPERNPVGASAHASGVREVKAIMNADFETKNIEVGNGDYAANSIRVMLFMTNMAPALAVFVNLGVVAVIWAGGL